MYTPFKGNVEFGYISHVIWYIHVAYLFYTRQFVPLSPLLLYCPSPLPSPHWQPLACSLYLWVCFFFVIFIGLLGFVVVVVCLFWATPVACGGSQARG